jgi:hypothetical protein
VCYYLTAYLKNIPKHKLNPYESTLFSIVRYSDTIIIIMYRILTTLRYRQNIAYDNISIFRDYMIFLKYLITYAVI